MPVDNKDSGEEFDLKRYRQAADVAYRYAKDRINRERSTGTTESKDPFGEKPKDKTDKQKED
jgi:hypothetical protein